MEFKLFGLVWDMRPVLAAIWASIGLALCVAVFFIHEFGYWNIPFAFLTLAYLATSESVANKILKLE